VHEILREEIVKSRVGASYYFMHFLVVLPVVGRLEKPMPLSGSQPVLRPSDSMVEIQDITKGGA
jgi:hypothetical protein